MLLNSEYSAKYLQQLWKKVRKQGGLCTGITQNIVDLLQNYTATTMLANSEFVALLKQANTDSSRIEDVDKSIGKIDVFGTGMREAGQKIANTFRTFADKTEKEYGEKKFSKTEMIKKPFQAKRKLLSGILNCVNAAIEKTEQLAADVRQYQTDKEERETGSVVNMEAVNSIDLARVAEPEFQYGAEAFEAYERGNKEKAADTLAKEARKPAVAKSR